MDKWTAVVIPKKDEKREIQGWPKLHLLGEAFGKWGEEGEAETAGEKSDREQWKEQESFKSYDHSQGRKALKPLSNAKPKQCFT